MHLLLSIDQGQMQRRVCGANAVASLESMILCEIADEAQVARDAAPVPINGLLMSSLTGDQAIAESVPALVVRVEHIYEHAGDYFTVDARADWAGFPIELTVRNAPNRGPQYVVAGYVAHVSDPAVSAQRRMRSGHYVAYIHLEGKWFELDDAHVTELAAPPERFPYLVFLSRSDTRRRLRAKQAHATTDARMLELLRLRAASCSAR